MTDEVKVEQIDAIKQAEEWLRAIHDWLLTFDYDMDLPSGILDVDPLDIADRLAARPAPAEDAVELASEVREAIAQRAAYQIAKGFSFSTLTTQESLRARLSLCARQAVEDTLAALAAMQPRGEQQAGREEGR